MASASALVDVHAWGIATAAVSLTPFELELGSVRKLRIPPQFGVAELERLFAVLEHR
jgi:hypothetical protein